MTARRAVRNDAAAHPTLATVFVFAALASMAAAFGSAYEEPWLLTWVLGGAAVVFAGLFVWALLPDGGPAEDEESPAFPPDYDPWACTECGAAPGKCPTYCSQWEPVSDYDEDVLGLSGLYDADDADDLDEAEAIAEQAADARWYGGAP